MPVDGAQFIHINSRRKVMKKGNRKIVDVTEEYLLYLVRIMFWTQVVKMRKIRKINREVTFVFRKEINLKITVEKHYYISLI